MTFRVGPQLDFGLHCRIVSIDPASSAGVVRADLVPEDEWPGRRFEARADGRKYACDVVHSTARRGDEMSVARRMCTSRPSFGLLYLLIEAQYIGQDPQAAERVIEARTRWEMAFEIECPKVQVVRIPASVWQAGWLGLGSTHGRDALKLASDLSAETAARVLLLPEQPRGDSADAFNMLLWWLSHHLRGLPRRFMTAAERGR